MAIDWYAVASEICALTPDGRERIAGTDGGRRALELLLGEENIRDAVDHFTDQRPGEFTAEAVLRIIRSTVAMERCYEIYKNDPTSERAAAAVFLLSEMADSRALAWMREFMEDKNVVIRWNGVMALQQILGGALNDEDIETARKLLINAESDRDEPLRARATEIRQRLASAPGLKYLGL
jgi:hypothetical protein